jgi:hypothetical protein
MPAAGKRGRAHGRVEVALPDGVGVRPDAPPESKQTEVSSGSGGSLGRAGERLWLTCVWMKYLEADELVPTSRSEERSLPLLRSLALDRHVDSLRPVTGNRNIS